MFRIQAYLARVYCEDNGVTCMLFIYFVYLVSADPDIGDIDGK